MRHIQPLFKIGTRISLSVECYERLPGQYGIYKVCRKLCAITYPADIAAAVLLMIRPVKIANNIIPRVGRCSSDA